ncbi:CdaR family protein [Metabacillus fastidiosus]|nr:YbbR-like domain-containing protein [Metabacillus fastidiosus]MED4454190.1 YbbR-like domain-containing protein [Metabacillus fastidiosus]MED4461128.1 YbbR-like domain-containing protein [Metabacillus fastidiosus]
MDKFMNNPWVMRIIALLFAILLYLSVNFDSDPLTVKKPGSSLIPPPATDTATVTDIPVTTYFDQENLVVTGVPETVNVTLEGPATPLIKARQYKDFKVYADLRNLSIGTHKIELKYKDLPKELEATINPAIISVSIEEKVTKDFSVDVDFLNRNKIKKGYKPEQPIVNPNSVQITASNEIIKSIDHVKATVDLANAEETVKQESRVTIYDKDGNVLPVEVEPSVVDITVPITSPSKTLTFKIAREGKLPEGISISRIESEPNEVTVFGPMDVLDKLEFINGISVDLSKIKDDTVIDVDVPKPPGVKKVTPEKIKLKIKVEKEEKEVFDNKKIKIVGLGEGRTLEFLDPVSKTLSVQVLGASSIVEAIKASDIELYVNVTDLGEGEHDVKVEVNGPQNITSVLPKDEVKVKITSSS